jgi:hypothetical protein
MEKSMGDSQPAKKKILILSDDERVARVIELVLKRSSFAETEIARQPNRPLETSNLSLIILVASSPASEPVVALAQAALVEQVGRIPLLIVSDEPFQASPDHLIFHLDLPFDHDELQRQVHNLLALPMPAL